MRRSAPLAAALLGMVVFVAFSASAQLNYLSRDSFIGYYEFDVDFNGQTTFSVSDADGTNTAETFNSLLVYPNGGTQFDDTTAAQFSQLFANAIQFDARVIAEEDVTDNVFGYYEAGAISSLEVIFQIDEAVDFTLTGTAFDAASGSGPGTTEVLLTGPGIDFTHTSGVLDFAGTFQPGEYIFVASAESIGYFNEGVLGDDRFRGEDLGFDALLLLDSLAPFPEGDYNAGGQVEQTDLDFVLSNWGDTDVADVPAWVNFPGQNPFDGLVDQNELDGVLLNWGDTTAPDFAGTAVPEPATLTLASLGTLALRARRRRRKP